MNNPLGVSPCKGKGVNSLFHYLCSQCYAALHSYVDPTDYFDNVMAKLIVNNRTDVLKTDINLLFRIKNVKLSALVR